MKKILIAQLVALIALGFTLPHADAFTDHTVKNPEVTHNPYTKQDCKTYAGYVGMLAEERDRGIDLDTTLFYIKASAEAIPTEASFFKNKDDYELIVRAANIVYGNPMTSGKQFIQEAIRTCYQAFGYPLPKRYLEPIS